MATDVMKKGMIEMIVLYILQQDGDLHGYAIASKIAERSKDKITVKEGSLYPILYRMTEDQFITGRDVQVETKKGRKRTRVLYSITEAGEARLDALIDDFIDYRKGVQLVFENSAPIGYGEPVA